ncbi:hypothetical protein K505DRAFT_365957 [Melanomma pulvis-pyrius CBS 109.77]|uniref:Endo-1,3(4)-beta-glucanase 1 carbohydrate binding domain-containing protein n=1 Tax=Melanomma pulvis-pyrius CBS 109.77 TaxID=1314802 RepID=A0A6A6WYL2_9PLEO|nr:hypothetical protein K505DRAFT_365957 [Melanomma pulvis-pyrius CBS 109.77]
MNSTIIFVMMFAALVSSETCGLTEYNSDDHVCYFGYYLCPILNGEPYQWCGGARGGCYSKFKYSCKANKLYALEKTGSAFELTLSNPKIPGIDGLPVHASGLKLVSGQDAKTSTYCDPSAPEGLCASAIKNRTIFGISGGIWFLQVQVPGGQRGYLDNNTWGDGLQYTAAHSASIPEGTEIDDFVAYENGGFFSLLHPYGWEVCQAKPHSGEGLVYSLRSRPDDGPVPDRCAGVNLLVKDSGLVDADHLWAWAYI